MALYRAPLLRSGEGEMGGGGGGHRLNRDLDCSRVDRVCAVTAAPEG